ncbi:carbohydrate ABC transporter permease [Lactococcus fujiensis]|uniref:carbohydrate ABC transporter permease n=1 Tax=Lactococcus fujiensis TaxID=610251 RepID=UPI0006D1FEB0|nr:carbohydrate ABC transporter permease [Lactococcus fujiensis]
MFNLINVVLLTLFALIIVVPVWNVVISSFATESAMAQNFIFFPKSLTIANYEAVLSDSTIWTAFGISVSKTVIGVITHVLFCSLMAYGMSKKLLRGRSLYSAMGIVTMFFGGGMIPTYLLIKQLGLIDNFLVYIIPALLSYYDVIILMNFFRDVPVSLEESAKIDGASDFKIFSSIILPLSKPALATIALFNGVGQWNDFMTAKLYVNNEALWPLQMRIYEIIVQSQVSQTQGFNPLSQSLTTTQGIQLATIVVTATPILIIYPLLQKHFLSGMMLGAVKE